MLGIVVAPFLARSIDDLMFTKEYTEKFTDMSTNTLQREYCYCDLAADQDTIMTVVHSQFGSGYWTRGEVISHFIGTGGRDYFARVTNRLTPNLMLGLELNRAVIGSTVSGFGGHKERRVGGGD